MCLRVGAEDKVPHHILSCKDMDVFQIRDFRFLDVMAGAKG